MSVVNRPGVVKFTNQGVDVKVDRCEAYVYTMTSTDPEAIEREKQYVRNAFARRKIIEDGNTLIVLHV